MEQILGNGKNLRANEKTTEEDIVFLHYSQAARELVMDLTMGGEDIVSIATIEDILTERDGREKQKGSVTNHGISDIIRH